ncbi:sporulation integral membrane protein YtvI [Desulfitispora alkaliphila]|uniref:AI-2E family transporter n=1 Tax=Desulfitispora alkaliphila TaxID=622674 RepID=UPI003D1F6E53
MKGIFSTRAFWRKSFLVVAVAFSIYLLIKVKAILPSFLVAAFMAYLLSPLVYQLEKLGLPRALAIVLIYISFVVTTALVIINILPMVIKDLNIFAKVIPDYINQLRQWALELERDYSRMTMPESIREAIDESAQQFEEWVVRFTNNLVERIISFFTQVLHLLIAPILAFYLLKDWSNIEQGLYRLLPVKFRTETQTLMHDINRVLRKFIRGHIIVATIVSIMTTGGLMALGMEFALILGIIAGIFDLVPYFGPVIGAIPAVALALLESQTMALYVIILFVVIQQIETNIISPKIMGDSLGLHPLSIIFSVLAGGALFGILGVLLAVPTIAICRVIFSYLIEKLVE